MNRKKPLQETAKALDLPAEVTLGLVKITLTGREEMTVVNHKGILVYEPERILFRFRGGIAAVSGRDLVLSELNEEGLRITGVIDGFYLKENTNGH